MKIISTATFSPNYCYTSSEIIEQVKKWIKNQPEFYQKKVIKIFESTQINKKHCVLPIEQIFSPLSFEEKNNYYKQAAIKLGCNVFEKAIKNINLKPSDIDYLVTTSCTGYMIPSLNAYLSNKFKFRKDIHHLPVTEMGCAGGTSGLIYAYHFLKAYPDKTAAVISVEAPSVTFQHKDFSLDNIVGSAIFADGAACAILSGSNDIAPAIIDTDMYTFPDSTDILGFNLTNNGFKIVLKENLPNKIIDHLEDIILPFINRNELSINEIDNFIFHPGGKKITAKIEAYLSQYNKNLQESKSILHQYGNMSSATVLFILDRILQKEQKQNQHSLMLSFGPGFLAQSILFKNY